MQLFFSSSQEMILKIQLLRLVHNFCSHSTYKHVLLSYGEMDELKQLYGEFESSMVPSSTSSTSSSSSASTSSGIGVASSMASLPYCTGGSGLLSKIIRVLKNVPTSSIFRCVLVSLKVLRIRLMSVLFRLDFGFVGLLRAGCAAAVSTG